MGNREKKKYKNFVLFGFRVFVVDYVLRSVCTVSFTTKLDNTQGLYCVFEPEAGSFKVLTLSQLNASDWQGRIELLVKIGSAARS